MTAETSQAPDPAPADGKPRRNGIHYLFGAVAVVVGGALVWGTALILGVLANVPPVLSASAQPSGAVSLSLAAYPDSEPGMHGAKGGVHPDWVTYGPTTSLWVPAHSLVKMTIRNYDSATALNNPFYATVQGTVGGVAYADGQQFTGLDPANVAHTFTIHMFPTDGQPGLDISVPLPGVAENAKAQANGYPKPVTVTFEFHTGAAGRYIWQCFDPCGGSEYIGGFGGPMSTVGYMAGTITVGGTHA